LIKCLFKALFKKNIIEIDISETKVKKFPCLKVKVTRVSNKQMEISESAEPENDVHEKGT